MGAAGVAGTCALVVKGRAMVNVAADKRESKSLFMCTGSEKFNGKIVSLVDKGSGAELVA